MKFLAIMTLITMAYSNPSFALDQSVRTSKSSLNQQFLTCLKSAQKTIDKELAVKKTNDLIDTATLISYLINDLKIDPTPLTKTQAVYLESELINDLHIECNIKY